MANKRLIDANALIDAFRAYMTERYDKEKCASAENCKLCTPGCLWKKIIVVAPTVDAVEVVRCRKCKYFSRDGEFNRAWCNYYAGGIETAVNGYCYHGVKMDGDGNV